MLVIRDLLPVYSSARRPSATTGIWTKKGQAKEGRKTVCLDILLLEGVGVVVDGGRRDPGWPRGGGGGATPSVGVVVVEGGEGAEQRGGGGRGRDGAVEEGVGADAGAAVVAFVDGVAFVDDGAFQRDADEEAFRYGVRKYRRGGLGLGGDAGFAGGADGTGNGADLARERDLAAAGERGDGCGSIQNDQKVRDLGANLKTHRHADGADRRRRRPASVGQPRHDEARADARGNRKADLRHSQKREALRSSENVRRRPRQRRRQHRPQDSFGFVEFLVEPEVPARTHRGVVSFLAALQRQDERSTLPVPANRVHGLFVASAPHRAHAHDAVVDEHTESRGLAVRHQRRHESLAAVVAHR
mmetsp:Transcript_13641/g.41223  ORF Transcript_13641/g.41223 Transcript_13641/m.41223 type:complete len:358 (-) Transcript_13641:181-1254(-)